MQLSTGPTVSKAVEAAQSYQVGLMLSLAQIWEESKGEHLLHRAKPVSTDCRVTNPDCKLGLIPCCKNVFNSGKSDSHLYFFHSYVFFSPEKPILSEKEDVSSRISNISVPRTLFFLSRFPRIGIPVPESVFGMLRSNHLLLIVTDLLVPEKCQK